MRMAYTVAEIAERLQGEVLGDNSMELTGFAPADRATEGDLTFAENESYFIRAKNSAAAAIIVEADYGECDKTLIRVPSARVAFAKAMPLFYPEDLPAPGIHPTATVHSSAQVDPTAHVGPNCVIGDRATIGAGCLLEAMVYVGAHCRLGEKVRVFPNVTIYHHTEVGDRTRIHAGCVIGADGFGYVQDEGAHLKLPQVGNVIIQEDVELGACVTIDRGALGPTVIGRGCKIDNLVQVAHNVNIGENSLIVAQAGIAGSTKIGSSVIIGGQVGIAGHLRIGNQVAVGAQSGVMHNLRDGERVLGTPAVRDRQFKRQVIAQQHLPDLARRVLELERRLGVERRQAK